MPPEPSPVEAFRASLHRPEFDPAAHLRAALARANGNASRNTYIAFSPEWSLAELRRQIERSSTGASKPDLFGLPVSLKDCFDLQEWKTSSGSKFYATHNPPAPEDSAIAAALKAAGAVITGKTHLHQLAYGITGENPDYGNCLQPADATRLTGGSSSGAAASVQEGSALAAIGTDTGGSIRLPAALCGLAGYRSSYGVADWRGGAHLAPSFDTIGWIFRDLRDALLLAESIFQLPPVPDGRANRPAAFETAPEATSMTIGVFAGPSVEQCDPAVQRALETWKSRLLRYGARLEVVYADFWSEAWEIFSPSQAYEAAKLHAGFFQEFEPTIAARLEWGAGIGEEEMHRLRQRRQVFCGRMGELFAPLDFVLTPVTPVSFLSAAQDQSAARERILRLTTPASVAGLPAVVLPSQDGGLQLLAAHNDDRRLLQFAVQTGRRLAEEEA